MFFFILDRSWGIISFWRRFFLMVSDSIDCNTNACLYRGRLTLETTNDLSVAEIVRILITRPCRRRVSTRGSPQIWSAICCSSLELVMTREKLLGSIRSKSIHCVFDMRLPVTCFRGLSLHIAKNQRQVGTKKDLDRVDSLEIIAVHQLDNSPAMIVRQKGFGHSVPPLVQYACLFVQDVWPFFRSGSRTFTVF